MKILNLRFKNLNALYGEWSIDFTRPEYQTQGLFAITGPTGSGKSTLLDAICLAMYGATPRLGRITKANNEIMSRQTGDCFSEVTFSTQSGTFRCFWHQHRARNKPEGNLTEASHEIADVSSGRVLETKKRSVSAIIEDVTGMDFERFTRSTLLAQGDFAAFLKASPDERSPILEQITGTEIYSEISMRVHERTRTERELLNRLQIKRDAINLPDEASILDLNQRQQNLMHQEAMAIKKSTSILEGLQWYERLERLQQTGQRLNEINEQVVQETEAFAVKREELARALKAMELDGAYASLDAQRRQQADDQSVLDSLSLSLPDQRFRHSQLKGLLDQSVVERELLKKQQKDMQPVFKAARALDLKIASLRERLEKDQRQLRSVGEKRRQLCRDRRLILEQQNDNQLKLDDLRRQMQSQRADDTLAGSIGHFNELVDQYRTTLERMGKLEHQLTTENVTKQKVSREVLHIQKQLEAAEREHQQKMTLCESLKQALQDQLQDQTLNSLRKERDSWVHRRMQEEKIRSLEAERHMLEKGKPCPLCGSTSHPFVVDYQIITDESEQKTNELDQRIHQIEQLLEAIRSAEQQERAAFDVFKQTEQERIGLFHLDQQSTQTVARYEEELQDVQKRVDQQLSHLNAVLDPYGLTVSDDIACLEQIISVLSKRLKRWNLAKIEDQKLTQKQNEQSITLQRLQAQIGAFTETIEQQRQTIIRIRLDINSAQEERHALIGFRDPDEQEEQLLASAAALDEQVEQSRMNLSQVEKQTEIMDNQKQTLEQAIAKRSVLLNRLQKQFDEKLRQLDFADEADYLTSCMETEARRKLREQADHLQKKAAEITSQLNDIHRQLTDERAKAVTAVPEEQLTAEKKSTDQLLREIRSELGAIGQQMADQAAAAEQHALTQAEWEQQAAVCDQWDRLHALIGSADGKKFRNFAQGLTFDQMIIQANKQLSRMSDRYLLTKDQEKALEISVIDQYQAGEVRSARNLSGGESFLVSLSLALGLSRMTSRKIRIESLFLDEGFGTLDDASLETALSALSTLQQEGQLIGMISHVSQLKERIRVQLNLKPVSGGRSILEGPGVMCLSDNRSDRVRTETTNLQNSI